MKGTNKTHEQILIDLEKLSKSISGSKKESLDFLVRIGVNTKTGKLSRNYSNPHKIPQRF